MWKRNGGANGGEDFVNDAVGGVKAVGADILPDFYKIETRFRVKRIAGQEPGWSRRTAALFSRK